MSVLPVTPKTFFQYKWKKKPNEQVTKVHLENSNREGRDDDEKLKMLKIDWVC